jgi:2-C-methyl-D-erythritol 4-phosphate cytidylyltransferase
MKKYVVIVAGGAGTRMKTDLPKQFLLLNKLPVLMHTIQQFYQCDNAIEIIVVLPAYQIDFWKKLCKQHGCAINHKIVEGGKTRYSSVKNGLQYIPDNCLVAVHDGVRPMVTKQIILNSFDVAEKKGSAIVAIPLKDSIRKKAGNLTVSKNRTDYYLVQTPQTFQSTPLKEAYSLSKSSISFTDDASVFEASNKEITLIEGDYRNIKITTPEDLIIAQALQESF